MSLPNTTRHFDDDDLLHDVEQKVTEHLEKHGLQTDIVTKIVKELMRELLVNWGGQQIYIKKTDWGRGKVSERDLEMYGRFNGRNHSDLAREYGITTQRVYEIIKIIHKIEVDKRQHPMFPVEEDDE